MNQEPEVQTKVMDTATYFGYSSNNGGSRPPSLEVKVLYVRVSYCPLDGIPDALSVRFPARRIDKYLEVNGARMPPSEDVCLTLRRDRMDTESVEVTYVSTDHLHVVGSLNFEVLDKEELMITATLQEYEGSSNNNNSNSNKPSSKAAWNMDCSCVLGSAGCVFTRGRHEYSLTPPTMEICVVGCSCGSPIILTRTVHLIARRRTARCGMLDAIPEDEECHRLKNRTALASSDSEGMESDGDRSIQRTNSNDSQELGLGKFLLPEAAGYGESEDGEMSWFNAGVRVGVGIGLGMCLGVGIGVGLMVRTYQATTRSFRRRLF